MCKINASLHVDMKNVRIFEELVLRYYFAYHNENIRLKIGIKSRTNF